MGRFIVKLQPQDKPVKYVLWSTVVDAPITELCDPEDIKKIMIAEAVDKATLQFDNAMMAAEFRSHDLVCELNGNRTGENGKELTLDEIYERYKKSDG